jgi:hypothetical protein
MASPTGFHCNIPGARVLGSQRLPRERAAPFTPCAGLHDGAQQPAQGDTENRGFMGVMTLARGLRRGLAVTAQRPRSNPPGAACRWLLLAGLLVSAGPFHASLAHAQAPQSPTVEGHVVDIQNEEIIIDLAGSSGAKVDDVVEVWRSLQVRHPVTKQLVRDRFVIGRLRLRRVGENLAKAIAEGDFDTPPRAGDTVVLRQSKTSGAVSVGIEPADPAGEPAAGEEKSPTPYGPAEPGDDETGQVARLFESLRGKAVVYRIQAYERWMAEHPQSRYARVLWEEAAVLRRLVGHELKERKRQARRKSRRLSEDYPRFVPPTEALAAQPFTFGLRLDPGTHGAMLHLRVAGQEGYVPLPMKATGGGFFRVTVPAKQMRPPKLEYFVERIAKTGSSKSVIGSSQLPLALPVRDVTEPAPAQPPLATIAMWTDYADYNRLRGDDVTWQTEGYFGMRFGDTGIRALRSGFGVYRGVGGSIEDLDELGMSSRKVGLTYGYLEGEFGITDFVGIVARPIIGLKDGGITGGGQAMLRLGNDLRTNLLLGGEFLGGVGLRGVAQLELEVIDDWPLMVRSEVTNQPAGSSSSTETVRPDQEEFLGEDTSLGVNDIGVRGIAQVGYRIADSFVVAVRGSYQGRTINHSGPGFGGALSYTW